MRRPQHLRSLSTFARGRTYSSTTPSISTVICHTNTAGGIAWCPRSVPWQQPRMSGISYCTTTTRIVRMTRWMPSRRWRVTSYTPTLRICSALLPMKGSRSASKALQRPPGSVAAHSPSRDAPRFHDYRCPPPEMLSRLFFRRGSLHGTTIEYGRLLAENLQAVACALHHKDPVLIINVYRYWPLERFLTLI